MKYRTRIRSELERERDAEYVREAYQRRMEDIKQKYKAENDALQASMKRGETTKIEILGQMENLMEENTEIRRELENYRRYVRNMEESSQRDGACAIQ